MITKDTVKSIAHLARLEFADSEMETFTGQLNSILGYIEKLNELDTAKVEATSHVGEVATPMRPDEVQTSEVIVDLLEKDAPDTEEGFFRVPKVI
jgi:aspartyl-tRNA(Asn)/glutamyl-tRNA(Gln) amidotransferase subunit C